MGWPPPIPINFERQKTKSMVNPRTRVIVAKPYQLALKYPNYKKDANLDAHVKVFNSIVKVNGETYEEYIINAFIYTFTLQGICMLTTSF
jgi:hypothetical protein